MSPKISYREAVQERLLSLWEGRQEHGGPVGCVATTFTFDAGLFEEECLARFVGMESDPREHGEVYLVEREEKLAQVFACVLVDRLHVPMHRSLRWNVLGLRVPGGGIFHAKVSLIVWERCVRILVGSANLTEHGYRRNWEHVGVLDFGPEGSLPKSLLLDVLGFLERVRTFAPSDGERTGEGPQAGLGRFLRQVRSQVRSWPEGAFPRGEARAAFVPVLPGQPSLIERVASEHWSGTGPDQAWILSPFFDFGGSAKVLVDALVGKMGQSGERALHFLTSGRKLADGKIELDLPRTFAEPWAPRRSHRFYLVREASDEAAARPLHAKSLWLQRGDRAACIVGSSNFTAAGFGVGSGRVNVEANLVYVLPSLADPFARKCEQACPPYEAANADCVRFVEDGEERTPEPLAYAAIPGAFGEALFEPIGQILRLFLGAGVPGEFRVRAESGAAVLHAVEWREAGGLEKVEHHWKEPRPPTVLLVDWTNLKGEKQTSLWPVNVTDGSRLLPTEELRQLPLEVLLEILTSALPLHESWRRAARRHENSGQRRESAEIDPHRKVDTRNFLLRRVRRVSAALEGLRKRLERPAFHLDGLRWRLHGPIGPVELARRLASEEKEGAAFLIAEVVLTLRRVDWSVTENALGRKAVEGEVAAVATGLRHLLASERPPENLRRYVEDVLSGREAVSWPVEFDPKRIRLHTGRVSEEDAIRQAATAREILRRLKRQPGLILADEVGMGKTFVALAVAASVAWADKRRRPVVVMVPSSLREKWPRDLDVFRSECLVQEDDRREASFRPAIASSGEEFFKLLDDPSERRAHVIFLTHGALYRALSGAWSKLAILKEAFRSSRLSAQREAFPRFAARVLRTGATFDDEQLFQRLLATNPSNWREVLSGSGDDSIDDPVPESILQVLRQGKVDLGDIRERLRELPLRSSESIDERILRVRRALNQCLQELWRVALVEARFVSPLLILDEAHHLKNPATHLASLFVEEEAEAEGRLLQGALSDHFERMLFLTATPFQLGHSELLNVLDRFRGIKWKPGSPSMDREEFTDQIEDLRAALDEAHLATTQLDKKWSRLSADSLRDGDGPSLDVEAWWRTVVGKPEEQPEIVQEVLRAYRGAEVAMRRAEDLLQPWVIRHLRARLLPGGDVPRRRVLTGAAIIAGREGDVTGIAVTDEAVLPFLLAARTEAVLSWSNRSDDDSPGARATTFAEGLASSYEAFLETRAAVQAEGGFTTVADELEIPAAEPRLDSRLRWYLERLVHALPHDDARGRHPKLRPTVDRVLDLWMHGEKVLVFCHWRATGHALQRHISRVLAEHIQTTASARLACAPKRVERELENLGQRFDPPRPTYRRLREVLDDVLSRHRTLSEAERDQFADVVRRFVRTPSFLLRSFPVEKPDSPDAFEHALAVPDASGLSLLAKLEGLAAFLAERCTAGEREEYLRALDRIQTGTRRGGERQGEGYALLPNVRLVNGDVDAADRRHVLLAFNTPFFPEILVASSVLAEGVDLQLDCRHIIHHDLSWNPSVLEQRTGRVDRIGAKAERVGEPIHVYLPYLEATQDEKMYRVVRDRERWFQVLMGEKYALDSVATEQMSKRLPLPDGAAQGLAFALDLRRTRRLI